MEHDADPEQPELAGASDVEKADIELGAKLARQRDQPVAKAAGNASKIGDQGPLYAMSAGLLIAGISTRDRRLRDCAITMLAGIAAADLSKRLTKRMVRRTRPHVLLDERRYERESGGSQDKPEQSFPSGHTACSVAAARALSRTYAGAGAAAGVFAVAIGISRITKGAHWPLDVLGGGVIGLAAEAVSAMACRIALRQR
ncbi:MAG: phosphatase PAP2 family protein [Chthoniobacterales bacterium]